MTRTLTKPLDDERAWREVLAAFHPDRRQDKTNAHETFIWLAAVKDHVCEANPHTRDEAQPRKEPRHRDTGHDDPDRIPYPAWTDFREATSSALLYADAHSDGYGRLLGLLDDCLPMRSKWREQERGASYRRLAAIGHLAGMDAAQRSRWYSVARSIPLSDRHAGHILSRLKRSEAA